MKSLSEPKGAIKKKSHASSKLDPMWVEFALQEDHDTSVHKDARLGVKDHPPDGSDENHDRDAEVSKGECRNDSDLHEI